MLVTFKTKTYADITMFGDIARELLKLMGTTGTVPGALLADDVPAALKRLRAGLQQTKTVELMEAQATDRAEDRADEELAVSLQHRALPLLELLEAAERTHTNVMWDG